MLIKKASLDYRPLKIINAYTRPWRMSKRLTARSPGKLILSGEHAVLYGKPALAMAVNRYAQSRISTHFSPAIFFNLLNLRYAKSLTLNTLSTLKTRLQENYNE